MTKPFQLLDLSRDIHGRDNGVTIKGIRKQVDPNTGEVTDPGYSLTVIGMTSPKIKAMMKNLEEARSKDFDVNRSDEDFQQAIRDGQEIAIAGLIDVPGGLQIGDTLVDMSKEKNRRAIISDPRFVEFGDDIVMAMNEADKVRIDWTSEAGKNSLNGLDLKSMALDPASSKGNIAKAH